MWRLLLPLIFLLSVPEADAHNREVFVPVKQEVKTVPHKEIPVVSKMNNLGLLIRQGRYRLAWA